MVKSFIIPSLDVIVKICYYHFGFLCRKTAAFRFQIAYVSAAVRLRIGFGSGIRRKVFAAPSLSDGGAAISASVRIPFYVPFYVPIYFHSISNL